MNIIEYTAAAFGILGTLLLAWNGKRAGWGFVAFLASNAGWIAFAIAKDHRGLLLQQLAFTGTSVLGIWRWIVAPRFTWSDWRGDFDGNPTMFIMPLLRWRGYAIDVHKFVAPDMEGCFHTHPARAIRVILWGGYIEEACDSEGRPFAFLARLQPGAIGLIRPDFAHRITSLPRGVSYSLWLRGRKTHPIRLVGDGWPAGAEAA